MPIGSLRNSNFEADVLETLETRSPWALLPMIFVISIFELTKTARSALKVPNLSSIGLLVSTCTSSTLQSCDAHGPARPGQNFARPGRGKFRPTARYILLQKHEAPPGVGSGYPFFGFTRNTRIPDSGTGTKNQTRTRSGMGTGTNSKPVPVPEYPIHKKPKSF